ncbi:MAG TPA: PKD domain-containing protein, partial [Thermoanaerobaculia bacterium]|nr:PKD domain-containing protein [Thermoanaerobaculia bacterium]
MATAFRLLAVCALIAAPLHALSADCTVTCTATVPATADTGSSVSFQSNASPCSCAGAASYHWTFGDGAESSAQNPSHVYSSAGTYGWQLTVTADGTTCTKSGSIAVSSGPSAGTYSGTTSAGLAFSL